MGLAAHVILIDSTDNPQADRICEVLDAGKKPNMSSQIDERLHETSDVIVARVPLHVFWVHQKSEKSETFKPCYLDHIREAPNVRHFQLAAVKSTAPTTAVGKSQKGKKRKKKKRKRRNVSENHYEKELNFKAARSLFS
jgi:hypothetical protein